jgi:hypothetical protein
VTEAHTFYNPLIRDHVAGSGLPPGVADLLGGMATLGQGLVCSGLIGNELEALPKLGDEATIVKGAGDPKG